MKLSVDVDELYEHLTSANIESNDAKAIIYDLIVNHDNENRNSVDSKPQTRSPYRKPANHANLANATTTSSPSLQESSRATVSKQAPEPEQQQVEPDPELARPSTSKVRNHKRINFSTFGGDAIRLGEG